MITSDQQIRTMIAKLIIGNHFNQVDPDQEILIEMERTENFTFCVAHAAIKTSDDSHRYFIFLFDEFGIEEYFQESNIIGKKHFIELNSAKTKIKNYFRWMNCKLDLIPFVVKPIIIKH